MARPTATIPTHHKPVVWASIFDTARRMPTVRAEIIPFRCLDAMMQFEFDPDKSVVNKAKHGIDFVEAQGLWRDPRVVEVSARTDDEPRFLAIGLIGEKHWSAVCMRRGDKVRLISVRRARRTEVFYYEGS